MTQILVLSDKYLKQPSYKCFNVHYKHTWNKKSRKPQQRNIKYQQRNRRHKEGSNRNFKTKNTKTKIKSLDGLGARIEKTENWISELEYRTIKLPNMNRERDWKKKNRASGTWTITKYLTFLSSETHRREKKSGAVSVFEEILEENFPNLGEKFLKAAREKWCIIHKEETI